MNVNLAARSVGNLWNGDYEIHLSLYLIVKESSTTICQRLSLNSIHCPCASTKQAPLDCLKTQKQNQFD